MASIPIFCDAHLHPAQLSSWQPFRDSPICASCHSESDINICMNLRHMYPGYILIGFGIHPQNPDLSLLPYLELLTESHAINCIGEAGFDFFTPEYCKKEQAQSLVWRAQLALAIKRGLPLVVHCRKALDRIFADSKYLAKLPAVIFHSFPGTPAEAQSLRRRGIRAFFSFGKQLLNGRRQSVRCAAELEIDWLLAETDAPYQTLKDEKITLPDDILYVYMKIAEMKKLSLAECCDALSTNYFSAFCL